MHLTFSTECRHGSGTANWEASAARRQRSCQRLCDGLCPKTGIGFGRLGRFQVSLRVHWQWQWLCRVSKYQPERRESSPPPPHHHELSVAGVHWGGCFGSESVRGSDSQTAMPVAACHWQPEAEHCCRCYWHPSVILPYFGQLHAESLASACNSHGEHLLTGECYAPRRAKAERSLSRPGELLVSASDAASCKKRRWQNKIHLPALFAQWPSWIF
jgi:hypothetical protein